MAIKRMTNTAQQTAIDNRAKLKARYKNFLHTIDDDIAAITNVATAKTVMTKLAKMLKVLARFTFAEADGE